MSLHHLFPQINLKPNPPKQPLSLWNPADYRRIYLWLLHDPFTLDAYVEQFAPPPQPQVASAESTQIDENAISDAESAYSRARVALIGWRLWLQSALLLAVIVIVACAAIVFSADSTYTPTYAPELSFLTGLALGEAILFIVYVVIGFWLKQPASGTLLGFILGVSLAILEFYQLHFTLDFSSTQWAGSSLTGFNLLTGGWLGIMLNTLIGVIRRSHYGPLVERVTRGLLGVAIVLFIISYNRGFGSDQQIAAIVQNIVLALACFALGYIRPIDWFYSVVAHQQNPRKDESWTAPRVTMLPTPHVNKALHYWLKNNWERGLKNSDQLWRYTNLHAAILKTIPAIAVELSEAKDQDTVEKVSGLLDPKNNYDWKIDDFLAPYLIFPALTRANLKQFWQNSRARVSHIQELFQETSAIKPELPSWHAIEPPLDDPFQASMAAFHYLRKRDLANAQAAFQIAGKSGMAKEMSDLCAQLQKLTASESWLERSKDFFKVENRPEKAKRPATWDALADFKLMLDEAWIYRRCAEKSENRALLRDSVYVRQDRLAHTVYTVEEGELLNAVARNWREPLNRWFDEREKPTKAKAIDPNPFKFGIPLDSAGALIGRKEQQESLLSGLERTQPILLYGQAGTGKSSLILRLPKQAKNKILPPIQIDLAALNLPHSTISQQVLKMLGQHLFQMSRVRAPDEHAANYLHRFHDFLVKACEIDPVRKIVVIIERLELVLKANVDDLSLLIIFLSNVSLHIPNFRVIFVGRVLPKEVEEIARNNSPIGMNLIKLSFLDNVGSRALLNTPLDSVIARFRDDAVDHLYDLTNGQPVLLQTMAYHVVARFNERQKDEKDFPDPVFSAAMIDDVFGMHLQGSEAFFDPSQAKLLPFWKKAEPFFSYFLEPADRRSIHHRQLLNEIAKEPDGVAEEIILRHDTKNPGIGQQLGLSVERVQAILGELETLDLLRRDTNSKNWKVAIELLRIYLLM